MLIPSMTLAEIRKEIEKDYPIVQNKSVYVKRKWIHELRPHGSQVIVKYFDYLSKYKNKWIIRLALNKKDTKFSYMAYYYNNIGIVGISPTADGMLTYHTSHFFKRFNERLHLNLTMPNDIIRTFLNENDRFHVEELEEFAPGIFNVFCATRKGYILATFDKNQKLFKMNTFITHDMLKGGQHDIANELNSEMQKYKHNAANLIL